jgi:glucose/arabinose dehydrogenase
MGLSTVRRLVPTVILAALVVVAPMTVARAIPPTDLQTSMVIGSGLNGPSGFEIAPDGRIFILERAGLVKIFKNGQLLAEPFADLPSEASGDRGLIGIAFDPEFGVANHYVYFYYTGHDLLNHLVRFDASGDVGTDGPFTIFQTQSPSQQLHVGGSIRFGPDGKLYFAVGDNGYPPNAQDLSNPHGKILRINRDGTIPPDNPFYGQPGRLGAIWAYGFRNPWRFQFDSATGELYGGDVGDFTWEEVNHIVKGGNYGWPVNEGTCTTNCAGFINPIFTYNHNGNSAAVTGGPVYRATMFPPGYRGNLFFGDYAAGFIKRAVLDADGNVTAVYDFDTAAGSVVDLKVAPDGSLYYLTYYPGRLYRITFNTNDHAPVAAAGADVTKGVEPLTVHFSSTGSSDPDNDPITFLWDFGDGTTSTDPNPTTVYPNKGVYTVTLTVSDGHNQSQATPIVVQVGIPPSLTVAAPVDGATYLAGDEITYNAFASDAAGLDLNDAAIKTEIILHHHTHIHPFLGPLTGRAGTFHTPVTGEASADTWFEIKVTATDATGLYATTSVFIYPRKSRLTFATSPPGLGVTLDGVPIGTPYTVDGVVGFQRELAAPPVQVATDGTVYHFTGWSDGGAVRHFVATPATDTTFTARYAPSTPFTGEYFANQDLAGTPVLVRPDPRIDFVWSTGSPDPAVPADHFSVRWTGDEYFATGRYRFTTATDDGVRLFLDGQLVVDHWQTQSGTAWSYVANLPEGVHHIVMEYFDNAVDATAVLSWDSTTDQPPATFTAQYWNVPGTGTAPTVPSTVPAVTRPETSVDHDWGPGSPDPAINPDHFVARWTRSVILPAGFYQFTPVADDGVRLYVDGTRVVDRWVDEGATSYPVTVLLGDGLHTIVLEYYENGGGALARLGWTMTSGIAAAGPYQAQFWNAPGAGSAPAVPSGPADVVRTDDAIDFDWGSGSPDPAVTPDHFVARWTRTVTLAAGVYRFSGASDDGIRVLVDGQPVVDKWHDQNEAYSVDRVLSGGSHDILVEYYEDGAGALVRFRYDRVGDVPPPPAFTGEYFANRDLAGTPVLTRQDSTVDFDWGLGSPDPAVPPDGFSARWTGAVQLREGVYTFTVTADDGVRLYVDGVLVVDQWHDEAPTRYPASRALADGTHQIVMEYYEAGAGAIARLGYERTGDLPPPVPFTGQYFADQNLAGTPVLTRQDSTVDFDWGTGAPDPALPADGFSVRWTRTDTMAAGTYRLTATGDDGIRVFVDGSPVIDGWADHPPTTYTADVTLAAGQHTVVIEYYDHGGGALARFTAALLG